jgi:hypothetical protein
MSGSPAPHAFAGIEVKCALVQDEAGDVRPSRCTVLRSSIPENHFPSSRTELIHTYGDNDVTIVLDPAVDIRFVRPAADMDLKEFYFMPIHCKLKGLLYSEGDPRKFSSRRVFEAELATDVGQLVSLRILRSSRRLGNASMVAQDRFVDSFVNAIKNK